MLSCCVGSGAAACSALWHSINERFLTKAARQLSTLTHTKPEAIEGMSVDAVQLASESDSKLHHDPYLGMLPLFVLKGHQSDTRHSTAS